MGFEIIAVLLMVAIIGGMRGNEVWREARDYREWLRRWRSFAARHEFQDCSVPGSDRFF